jgi:hypothetical protein
MELKAILSLALVTLPVIGLVIYFGSKANKRVQTQAPESRLAQRLSLTGTALMACVLGFWLIALVAGKLRPDTPFGAFVGTTDGIATVLIGSFFFAIVAAVFLERLGYPIRKEG